MTDEIWRELFGEDRQHRSVVVYNREDFEDFISIHGLNENLAYIEIYTGPQGKPLLSKEQLKQENTIALDFDDFPEDVEFPNSTYKPLNPTITYAQAVELVQFIYKNWGKDFIIHCDAGVSRSQQVAAYIIMAGHGFDYEYDDIESSHPHHFFNTIVLSRLLETKHRLIPDFNNKDGRMKYNNTLDKWLEV